MYIFLNFVELSQKFTVYDNWSLYGLKIFNVVRPINENNLVKFWLKTRINAAKASRLIQIVKNAVPQMWFHESENVTNMSLTDQKDLMRKMSRSIWRQKNKIFNMTMKQMFFNDVNMYNLTTVKLKKIINLSTKL